MHHNVSLPLLNYSAHVKYMHNVFTCYACIISYNHGKDLYYTCESHSQMLTKVLPQATKSVSERQIYI